MNAVVIAVLIALMAQGGCDERAGAVIQNAAGEYRATDPIKGIDDSFGIRVRMSKGEHIVAIYHTHPGCTYADTSARFSPQDVDTAARLNVPSYIGVLADKTIRVYDPHRDVAVSSHGDLRAVSSAGRIVLVLP